MEPRRAEMPPIGAIAERVVLMKLPEVDNMFVGYRYGNFSSRERNVAIRYRGSTGEAARDNDRSSAVSYRAGPYGRQRSETTRGG